MFGRLSNSICFIMAQEGHFILDYMNGYLIFGNEGNCRKAFDRLTNLLHEFIKMCYPVNR